MQTPPRSKGGGQIILTKPLALQIGMALTLRSAGPVKQAARPVDAHGIDDIPAQPAKHGTLHHHHPLIAQPDTPIAQRELQRPRREASSQAHMATRRRATKGESMMDGATPIFLAQDAWEGKIFSGGWDTAKGGSYVVSAPADGSVVASVGNGNAADVARAAAAAAAAQPAWDATAPAERARILNLTADILEAHGDELIPWIIRESGSIYPKASIEIEHSAGFLRAAAATALEETRKTIASLDGRDEELIRVPHGVVGVISPFNFPLILSVRAIAAALATGNAVVHKPDPRTPITGGIIIARIFEEAGLPKDLLHSIPGGADVGMALCEDPNIAMISFTGSPGVGAKVGEACGRNLKKVQLELGGKNALIILDDADLALAASNAAWGTWLHQGQICMATGMLLAPTAMADQLAAELAAKAARLPVGNPATDQCALGPLISDGQVALVTALVEDAVAKGATLLAAGTAKGCMFPATDTARARRLGMRLKVGHLHINDQTVMASPNAPFG
jgi:benzaldehyde dehydrogenase (NAD)